MKKFTILVDMDDTLVNTCQVWIEWLNEQYDLNVKYEDLLVWEMQAAFPSLTTRQLDSPLFKPEFWGLVEPKAGAVEYLKKLIEDGHRVFICSASHPANIFYKVYNCLLRDFNYLDTKQLIFTTNKQLLQADFLIDDGIHNLVDAPYKGILINTPYNRLIDESKYDNIVRADDFEAAYNFIKEQADECG